MQLKGRLRLTTLGDLLGTVLRENLSGTLELTEEQGPRAGRLHRLYLQKGHVVQVDTQEAVQPLGELLVAAGCFERRCLVEYVAAASNRGAPLGQWLVDEGKVSHRDMVEAVVQQLRLRIEALFRVEDARIAFRLIQPRRRELDAPRPLDARDYLLGRPRARDRNGAKPGMSQAEESRSLERRRDLLILGLGPAADECDVRSRFRRMARALHPDSHPDASPRQREVLVLRFAEISSAYHRLVCDTKIAV